MYGVGIGGNILDLYWRGMLADYATAIAWSPDGQILAASSAAGEVVLWRAPNTLSTLQAATGQSVDCLGFSKDSQFLAAGGQNGAVNIWRVYDDVEAARPLHSLENAPAWVDRLAWSPHSNLLAFATGRTVQVWDADREEIAVRLNFEASSVLDLAWHPAEPHLAASGERGVKIWKAGNWQEEPYKLTLSSASLALAWSPDGKYLATCNMDRSVTVLEWGNPHPWVMRGFAGKMRKLAWSDKNGVTGAPLLAAASAQSISVWEKQGDASGGWEPWELEAHEGTVSAIAFQPGTFLLASAAADGWVCLWNESHHIAQILEGNPAGFSNIVWDNQGTKLAAATGNGELLIWSKSTGG